MNCPHCGGYIEEEEKKSFLDKLFNEPVITFKRTVKTGDNLPPDTVINQNILVIDKNKIKDPNLLRLLEGFSD